MPRSMNSTANDDLLIITFRGIEVHILVLIFAKGHPEIFQNGEDIALKDNCQTFTKIIYYWKLVRN
jgi:hypothetical protein